MKQSDNTDRQLFVTDLDGTFLGTDSRVSPESARMVNELIEAGTMISVATARTPATVVPLLKEIRFRVPLIVMTGAAMWDPVEETYINRRMIEPDLAWDIMEICRRHGISPFTYTLGDNGIIHTYHSGEMTKRERAFADERSRLPLKRINCGMPEPVRPYADTIIYFAIGDRNRIFGCAESLRSETAASVSAYPDIFNKEIGLLEIFAPDVSKAKALSDLKAMTGATYTTVFGDNLNDLDMMRLADRAVAVDNAFDEVKAAADIVIGRNSEDSVAKAIGDFRHNIYKCHNLYK